MKRTSYALAGLGLVALGLAGCEIVLGLDEREVYKDGDASIGGSGGGGQGGEAGQGGVAEAGPDAPVLPPGCFWPKQEGADPNLRIGSFIASSTLTNVDFCLKPSTATSWDKIDPLVWSSGADCPKGLMYRDLTSQFYVEPGVYEVKVIAAGDTCQSEGVATLSQAQIEAKKANDLLVYGDGANNTIVRLQESRSSVTSAFKLRMFHAANGIGSVDFGLPDKNKLPATLADALLFKDVSLGATAAKGSPSSAGAVDQNGYVDVQLPSDHILVGVAPTGSTAAIALRNSRVSTGLSYTLFFAGLKDNPAFPLQLWTCSEMETDSSKLFASCGDGLPLDISFDSFNTQLNGSFSKYEQERRQPIIDAISALKSDAICVTEIWDPDDKKALAEAAAAAGNFKYSYYSNTNWDTLVDDPTDQNGNVPPPYTTPACAASLDKMNAALDCLKNTCMGGDENGRPDAKFKDCTFSCATTALLPLITGEADDRACWSCVFTQMASYETVAWTRDKCANDPKARFVFGGSDGAMILSKRPLNSPSTWVLPATEWRVSVLRAPMSMDNGANVDAYCTVLTTPTTSCMTRPYTGQYGGSTTNPMDCNPQWVAELELQSKKLVDYVKKNSLEAGTPAVVLGEFYTGTGFTYQGNEVLKAQYPQVYQNLIGAFAPAVPLVYTPQCTYCANENSIITPPGTPTTSDNNWTSNVFLGNHPQSLVKSAETLLKDATIQITPEKGEPFSIPLSQYYLFRSTVRMYP